MPLTARFILGVVVLSLHAQGMDFFIAPDGRDDSPGTRDHPFTTLLRARDATRKVPSGEPRRVIVRGGFYYNTGLVLESQDSGLTLEAAPGEKPVLCGGQLLTDWASDGDGLYAASLPDYPAIKSGDKLDDITDWQIRLLQVDGRLCPRARFPETGTLEHATSFDVPWMSTTGGGWKRRPTHDELTTLRYKPGILGEDLEVKNAEVTVFHMWDESCVGVVAHDPTQGILKLAPAAGHPPGAFGVKKFVVWNVRQGMRRPGQWYHDRARHKVVYWPLPGQDMRKAEVIVPTRSTILRLRGTPEAKIHDVTIQGLSLAVTTVPLITGGFAAAAFDGAVSLEQAENCRFDRLMIARVAGQGINARRDRVKGVRVEHCEISDCGAGGIYVGGTQTVIANNHVHGIGRLYPSAVGIFRGGKDNRVSHNEVHDCTYSAINYGGENVVIEANHLYDCMKELHDGAAIYVFAGTNCVLRHNFAHDITDTGGYGASAYYLDERCWNCVVEKNVSLRVGWPSHNHMATNNIIRNNLFVVEGDAKITLPRSEQYTLERNIIYATGKIRIENINGIAHWSKNLFYSGANRIEQVAMQAYSAGGIALGPPGDTIVADPLFKDWRNGDLHFAPDSPALSLGIEFVDHTLAGPEKR